MSNKLQFEKSPYLLQHKENPVDWMPWGNEAFEKAKEEDKPIFLSIGYSTCHWCHVMAHESFEDDEVARVINNSFVAIKVDREERTDIDSVYMAACMAMTGSGGWPLTIIMTNDGKPFYAGTYLGKRQLIYLLEKASKLWESERSSVNLYADNLSMHLKNDGEKNNGETDESLTDKAFIQLTENFDAKWGGFSKAPKFPMPHNLIFLMRHTNFTQNQNGFSMAAKTLEMMFKGGIFDHIGGGFSRYSTDEKWLVPHFEKMLYDNALLIYAYSEAFSHEPRQLFKVAAERSIEYVLNVLKSEQGGFYCGEDADSEGVEGKFYLFTKKEIEDVIGEKDAKLFCEQYGITEKGNFEGKSIPNLIKCETEENSQTAEIKEKLKEYRRQRTQLHKDDKILTSWNGLMIAALAKAGFIFENESYIKAAEDAVKFIENNLTDKDKRLKVRFRDGEASFCGKLEDYAFYAWGLIELYGATFKPQYLKIAQRVLKHLQEWFFDNENGGYYPYAHDDEQLLTRKKDVYDGAIPSGNAVITLVLTKMKRITLKKEWDDILKRQLSYMAGAVSDYPSAHCFFMLTVLKELYDDSLIICTAKQTPEELVKLLREKARFDFTVIIKTEENAKELESLVESIENYKIEDIPKYYLCKNKACTAPTDSIDKLYEML